MMIRDERYDKCYKLAEVFQEYLIMDGALDYSEAKIKSDAPDEVKKAYEEYKETMKKLHEEEAKSPFM